MHSSYLYSARVRIVIVKKKPNLFELEISSHDNIWDEQFNSFKSEKVEWDYLIISHYYSANMALSGVAQWTERQPVNQSVTDSIPSQGTCLGCGPGPQ